MISTQNHIPLIAILRGITPNEIFEYTEELVNAGFSMIEVPLNSPDALTSIEMLVKKYGSELLIGAGTVTNLEQAKAVIATGANLVVTPNFNADVVSAAVDAGCSCYPGVVTPTEAFAAAAAGATGLKFFPINMIGLEGFKAVKSVLPSDVLCYPVGGIDATEESMYPYLKAGAAGFGLGSALFKPAMSASEVGAKAKAFVKVMTEFTG